MTRRPLKDVGTSVRARLLRLAKDRGDDFQLVLTRYANERLLFRLASRPGVVHTREQLLLDIWGWRDASGTRTVDSHVAALRRKLGEDADDPKRLLTVRGVGLRFEP